MDADIPGKTFDTENPMALSVYCRRSRELDMTQSRGQRESLGRKGPRTAWGQRGSHLAAGRHPRRCVTSALGVVSQ